MKKIAALCKATVLATLLATVLTACTQPQATPTASPVETSPPAPPAAPVAPTPTNTAEPAVLAPRATPALTDTIPAWATQVAKIAATYRQETPILALDDLDENQRLAQDLALHDPRVVAGVRDSVTQEPLRVEVFGVYPARESDYTDATAACRQSVCYRVELYNYAQNAATVAMVDVPNRAVLAVNGYADLQPDIPPHLVKLAEEIAIHAPEVAAALGGKPEAAEAMMANTKTALNRTQCERSRHLCVAPTFMQGDRALWAIVDLTDGVLVGTRWTALGKSGTGPVVTEKKLQDDVVTRLYCDQETPLTRDDWDLNFILTSSDGLRISDVRYQGKPVLDDAKLVDWHVSYSRQDGFGYSDAVGCPVFSQAAVVAHEGPIIRNIVRNGQVEGFSVTQNFIGELWPIPCNYYYRQRYEFYNDGRFRVVAGNVGRGCGDDGMYRPVLRLGVAGDDNSFASWDGSGWKTWETEGWQLQDENTVYSPEGYLYRISNPEGNGYYMEPGQGQFGDGGRGDNAFTYVTASKPGADEGQSDLITIGPCCNPDYQQGPEKFIEPSPDPIDGSHLVVWYVPQMKNDDTPGEEYCWADIVLENGEYTPKEFPCYAGPMFVPIQK